MINTTVTSAALGSQQEHTSSSHFSQQSRTSDHSNRCPDRAALQGNRNAALEAGRHRPARRHRGRNTRVQRGRVDLVGVSVQREESLLWLVRRSRRLLLRRLVRDVWDVGLGDGLALARMRRREVWAEVREQRGVGGEAGGNDRVLGVESVGWWCVGVGVGFEGEFDRGRGRSGVGWGLLVGCCWGACWGAGWGACRRGVGWWGVG